ncbi:hypothetical protein D3C87_1484740 [compost metagenome]
MFRHSDEVIITALFVLFTRRQRPFRTELITTTNIRYSKNATFFQPSFTSGCSVLWCDAVHKSAITVKQSRMFRISNKTLFVNQKVGNLSAISTCSPLLRNFVVTRKLIRHRTNLSIRVDPVPLIESRRRSKRVTQCQNLAIGFIHKEMIDLQTRRNFLLNFNKSRTLFFKVRHFIADVLSVNLKETIFPFSEILSAKLRNRRRPDHFIARIFIRNQLRHRRL